MGLMVSAGTAEKQRRHDSCHIYFLFEKSIAIFLKGIYMAIVMTKISSSQKVTTTPVAVQAALHEENRHA